MGSVGSTVSTSTSLVGQDVTSLRKYSEIGGRKLLREDFNLDFATESQLSSIISVFRGMEQYDKGFDENKTPYQITDIKIRRIHSDEDLQRYAEMGMKPDKTIQLSITTAPQTDSAYIRMMDTKYRTALIGPKGGYYTYGGKNYRRQNVSDFDIKYGVRR